MKSLPSMLLKHINLKMILKYILLLALSFIFLFFFSLWTSPFYKNWYGCDASFFTLVGRGIKGGLAPYRDFFDLKGPYFFFIEALGQLIKEGRTGAFIIQVGALFFSLVLIIRICRMFISVRKTVFVTCVFLFGHIATLWGGNTLEEFMLPLLLLCLYCLIGSLFKPVLTSMMLTPHIPAGFSLMTGICFGVIMFAKITVAAPIAGLVIGICIIFLMRKNYRELFLFLLYSFLGILIAALPVFIYFFIKGAISDMLYAVFVFAFKRSVDFDEKFNIRWELKLSGCYFAFAFAILHLLPDNIKSIFNKSSESRSKADPALKDMCIIILSMSLVSYILLHLGDPFIYYFTTVYPVLILSLAVMLHIYDPLSLFTSLKLDICALLLLICGFCYSGRSTDTLKTVIYDRDNSFHKTYYDDSIALASLIPDFERDSVMSFNIDMQWFEINGIMPCYKYLVNLQFFTALDHGIREETIEYLKETPPKWLVVGDHMDSYIPEINEVILSEYEEIYSNSVGTLFLLSGGQ